MGNHRRFLERDGRRRPGELRGDDFYYGGGHAQRDEWERREFDNNPADRREGMYRAGGRDFDERLRETYEADENLTGWWASHNPVSGDRPWYEGERRGFPRRPAGASSRGFLGEVRDFFGVGPKGYRRSDDRILEEVCESLARHPGVDASDIEVNVKNGHVTLRGTVPNRWMRRQAEDAVELVPGVDDVHVELAIQERRNSA